MNYLAIFACETRWIIQLSWRIHRAKYLALIRTTAYYVESPFGQSYIAPCGFKQQFSTIIIISFCVYDTFLQRTPRTTACRMRWFYRVWTFHIFKLVSVCTLSMRAKRAQRETSTKNETPFPWQTIHHSSNTIYLRYRIQQSLHSLFTRLFHFVDTFAQFRFNYH